MNGIALLISATLLPGFYYGLSCHSFLQFFYTSAATSLLSIALAFSNFDTSFRKWKNFVVINEALMASTAIFSLVPMIHWICIAPRSELEVFLPKVLKCLGLYGLGFTIFITKIPERLIPGAFDYLLSSHQVEAS